MVLTKPTLVDPLASLRIRHPRIKQMMKSLSTSLDPEGPIIAVIGPSGVGKSVLGHFLVEDALKQGAQEMAADPSFLPAVWVEAHNSGEHEFSWRMFYTQLLAALGENMDMPRMAYGVDQITGRLIRAARGSGNSLPSLRMAVERALIARKVRFLVIDEAAQITRQARGARVIGQIDTLKSLANSCGVQLILLGSYDLYELVSLSAQIARRIHVMHFQRYQQGVYEDEVAFAASVKMFQDACPKLWGNALLEHASALHENTVGCVGTLRSVLVRGSKIAEARGGWSKQVLTEALLTEAQRLQILMETQEGEKLIIPGVTRALGSDEIAAAAKMAG